MSQRFACALGVGPLLLASALGAQTPMTASGKPVLVRGEQAGMSNDGKPFEEICDGRLVGIAVRTSGDLHITKRFSISMGEQSGERVTAVAPICANADGQRQPLNWHGGKGTDAEFLLDPEEPFVALSGTFAGRRQNELGSLQVHTDKRSSDIYGVEARATDDNPSNDLFILTTPRWTVPIGLQGRAGDQVSRIGVVYANASDVPVVAALAGNSAGAASASDVQQAVERGLKAKGSMEGASVRNSLFSMTGTGFGCTVEGPLNQIANAASARAKLKQTVAVDAVPTPVPAALVVTARPFDSSSIVPGGNKLHVQLDFNTAAPTAILLVSKQASGDQVVSPIYVQRAYFETTNLDDPGPGMNPFVGVGMTAVFPLASLPAGEFDIRVVTPHQDYTVKVDAKARAKIR